MRQIATLPDEPTARRFADYLLTLKIDTRLDRDDAGVAVWVCDEDRLAEAKRELETFQQNPSDPRYLRASPVAAELRRAESAQEEVETLPEIEAERSLADSPLFGSRPITIGLITASVVVAVLTQLGEATSGPVIQALSISTYVREGSSIRWPAPQSSTWPVEADYRRTWVDDVLPYLRDIRAGQVWRLVTPIFIHFGIAHLAFNLLMLYALGSRIEGQRGSAFLLGLVLVTAVVSNLCQYYPGVWELPRRLSLVLGGGPAFGGMSGVLYGLFGYMWMKARFAPELGLEMPQQTVILLMGWFFLCIFDNATQLGLIGPVANVAHGVGLLVGLMIGYAPHLWQRRR